MTRQQKRKALRDAEKDLKKAVKTKEFVCMSKYFNTLPKEEYELLHTGQHTDEKAVATYKRYDADMHTFCEMEARVDYYKGLLGLLPVKEKN